MAQPPGHRAPNAGALARRRLRSDLHAVAFLARLAFPHLPAHGKGRRRPGLTSALVVPLLALLAPAAAHATAQGTIAVFPLQAKTGVDAAIAEVLTDNLTDTVRRTRAFSKVVSSKEIETLLGFEKQKQMMNCDTSGCVAELAGALGVDYLLAGNISRVGSSFVLNAQLLNTRSGSAASSISHRMRGSSEEALLDAVQPAVVQLLREAGMAFTTPEGTPVEASSTSQAAPVPVARDASRRPRMLASGSGAVVAGVVAGALAAVLGAGAILLQLAPRLMAPPVVPGLSDAVPYPARAALLYGGSAVMAALAVVGVLLAVAGLVGGGAAFAYAVATP